MKKRNSKIHEFVLTNGAKPLCAKLGLSGSIMASGDSLNTVSLWRLNKDRPIHSLANPSSNSSIQSEVNCVCFGINEDEVYSGSSRGAINIWDIESQKLSATLKGHTVNVSCITHFDSEDRKHLILSGSYDTSIKLWDLRQKNCVNTYKGHTMEVKCLEVSPDGNWAVSGSQDSKVKVWEISTGKVLQTFENHDSPVLCAKFNPSDFTLASGSLDRTVKYYELEKWSMLFTSKPEATGILALKFNEDGGFLFSAAQENLKVRIYDDNMNKSIKKVWKVLSNSLQLMDSVESNWRGIQDLGIGKTDEGKSVIGITISPICFGLWSIPYKYIHFDGPPLPEKKDSIKSSLSTELPKTKGISDPKSAPIIHTSSDSNNVVGKNVYNTNEVDIANPPTVNVFQQNMLNQQDPNPNNQIKKDPANKKLNSMASIEKINEERKILPKKFSIGNTDQVIINDPSLVNKMNQMDEGNRSSSNSNKADTSINENNKTSVIHFRQNNSENDLNYSAFITIDPEVKRQNEIIFDMMKDHTKFKGVMATRINHLKPVLHWWNAGNMKSAINAINMMNIADPTVALDLLNMGTSLGKSSQMPIEAGCVFLQKAAFLIDCKIDVHIKKGIEFISNILKIFQDDIIAIKNANVMNMVDIAREERIKKYDKLIEDFEKIYNKDSLKKRADKKKDELGEASNKLRNELETFLNRLKKIN